MSVLPLLFFANRPKIKGKEAAPTQEKDLCVSSLNPLALLLF
jgi:hypothetical protein